MANWNAIKWTPEMDAEILRVYTRRDRGGNKRLALTWGVQPRSISARAVLLGAPALSLRTQLNGHGWTDAEKAMVAAHLGEPIAQLRARLYHKGFYRSADSIRGLLQRMRAKGAWPGRETQIEDQDAMTIPALCAGMGVGDWQVARWVRKGLLRAGTLGGDGLHSIRWADLHLFLTEYPGHWDHRLADKWFLVDALAYRPPTKTRNRKTVDED